MDFTGKPFSQLIMSSCLIYPVEISGSTQYPRVPLNRTASTARVGDLIPVEFLDSISISELSKYMWNAVMILESEAMLNKMYFGLRS